MKVNNAVISLDDWCLHMLQGVRVGESWKDRLDCRQWGAHFPHVAGIAGQSNVGAQSVVLSGGYGNLTFDAVFFCPLLPAEITKSYIGPYACKS